MEKGFAHLLLLLGILLSAVVALGLYLWKMEQPAVVNTSPVTAQVLPTPTPIPLWKTYTNSKYNFELTYPYEGMLWAEDAYQLGECGQAIKEGAKQTNRVITSFVKEVIQLDSFFEVLVLNGPQSIEEYITKVGGQDQYNLLTFEIPGADEAVEVLGLKKGAEYAVGYPPLTYISHIFRKGEKIFLIKHFFNPHNLGGCVDPALLDPVSHSHLKIKDWNLKKTFRFI